MRTRLAPSVFAAASLTLFAAAAPATGAQFGNPGFAAPGAEEIAPGVPAAAPTNAVDRIFVLMAAIGGMSEVELGKLAQQRGANEAVQAFGKRMTEDHGSANQKLTTLAKNTGLPMPSAVDPKHRSVREGLEKLEGADFDHAYIGHQIGAHQMTAQLLAHEIGSGASDPLKDFAAETLPLVLGHLDTLHRLDAELRGATPRFLPAADRADHASKKEVAAKPDAPARNEAAVSTTGSAQGRQK